MKAPTNPKEALRFISRFEETEGLEGLLEGIDWSNSTAEQLRNAFDATGPFTQDEEPLISDGRLFTDFYLRSQEFQSKSIEFAINAYPEKTRLLFVHIPKCGGTTVTQALRQKHPWVEEHLVSPEWTSQGKLFRALGDFYNAVQSNDSILITGHYPLKYYVDKNIYRPGDKIFAIIRHPYKIAISYVNYIFERFYLNPLCTDPDTRLWAESLGIEKFDPTWDQSVIKELAFRLLYDRSANKTELLTEFLGIAGSASSAIALIKQTGIELVHLDGLKDWLKCRWNIVSDSIENQSGSFLKIEDLDSSGMEWLRKECSEDLGVYEYIIGNMALTDSASIV